MHEQIRKRFWNSHSCCLVVLYFNSVQSDQKKEAYHRWTHSQILSSLLRISPSLLSTSSYPSATTTTTTTLTYFSIHLPFSSSYFSLSFSFLLVKERGEMMTMMEWLVLDISESLTEHNFQKGSWKMQCVVYSTALLLLLVIIFVTYSTCLPALVIVIIRWDHSLEHCYLYYCPSHSEEQEGRWSIYFIMLFTCM